jgi:hypothetical protein
MGYIFYFDISGQVFFNRTKILYLQNRYGLEELGAIGNQSYGVGPGFDIVGTIYPVKTRP